MLIKENKAIKKNLQGEYKDFANLLVNNINSKCEMDSFSHESINQILSILYDGQKSGKPFEEIISEPYETIHHTINALKPKPKKYILKLAFIFSLSAILIVFTTLFFSLWMPVALEKPVITFSEDGSYIQWQQVANAKKYEVSIDGSVRATTSFTYYYLPEEINEQTFEAVIKPIGSGRYITSANSIGSFTGKLIDKNSNFDINAFPSRLNSGGIGREGGYEYRLYLTHKTELDAFGRVVVKCKPDYNGYYLIEAHDVKLTEVIKNDSISEKFDCQKTIIGSSEIYTTEIQLARGEYQFTFSANKVNYSRDIDILFYLCAFNVDKEYIINPGITLFTRNPLAYGDGYATALSAPEGIQFYNIAGSGSTAKYETICLFDRDYGNDWLLAIENNTIYPITIGDWETRSVAVNDTSGILNLKKGYTIIKHGENLDFSNNEILSFYALDPLKVIKTYNNGTYGGSALYPLVAGGYTGFQYDHKAYGDAKTYTIIFSEKDIELKYSYGSISEISGNSEKEIPFGFFKINNYTVDQLTALILSEAIYCYDEILEEFINMNELFLIKYGSYCFFNPHAAPVAIKFSPITIS